MLEYYCNQQYSSSVHISIVKLVLIN